MEEYIPSYCTRCAQLRWQRFIGKPCQFCGDTTFVVGVRPPPTYTQYDRRELKRLCVAAGKKEGVGGKP